MYQLFPLRKSHAEVSKELKDQYRFFRQGEMGRTQLLDAFIQSQNVEMVWCDLIGKELVSKENVCDKSSSPNFPFEFQRNRFNKPDMKT